MPLTWICCSGLWVPAQLLESDPLVGLPVALSGLAVSPAASCQSRGSYFSLPMDPAVCVVSCRLVPCPLLCSSLTMCLLYQDYY